MTAARLIPPRTVYVSPLVFHSILRKTGARVTYVAPASSLLPNIPPGERGPHIHAETIAMTAADEQWTIVSDPDCPIDYAWPEVTPPEVAAIVRQGIADAKERT